MSLVKFIDLTPCLFLSNDRLALRVTEALQNALMIELHLFLLLLFLLELEADEFNLLLCNSPIFDSLAFE